MRRNSDSYNVNALFGEREDRERDELKGLDCTSTGELFGRIEK